MSDTVYPAILTHRIYLVRHGDVAVPANICYGQLDCAVSSLFEAEQARLIHYFLNVLGNTSFATDTTSTTATASTTTSTTNTTSATSIAPWIISSPLTRCARLATGLNHALSVQAPITTFDAFKEINFGEWEGKTWQNIGEKALTDWGDNLLDYRFPKGESTREFDHRVIQGWQHVMTQLQASKTPQTCVVIAHAGVIRSILSHFLHMPLQHSLLLKIDKMSVSQLEVVCDKPALSRCVSMNKVL